VEFLIQQARKTKMSAPDKSPLSAALEDYLGDAMWTQLVESSFSAAASVVDAFTLEFSDAPLDTSTSLVRLVDRVFSYWQATLTAKIVDSTKRLSFAASKALWEVGDDPKAQKAVSSMTSAVKKLATPLRWINVRGAMAGTWDDIAVTAELKCQEVQPEDRMQECLPDPGCRS
jgi:hypothetical protein